MALKVGSREGDEAAEGGAIFISPIGVGGWWVTGRHTHAMPNPPSGDAEQRWSGEGGAAEQVGPVSAPLIRRPTGPNPAGGETGSTMAGPRPMKLRAGIRAPHAKGVGGTIMIQEAFIKGEKKDSDGAEERRAWRALREMDGKRGKESRSRDAVQFAIQPGQVIRSLLVPEDGDGHGYVTLQGQSALR